MGHHRAVRDGVGVAVNARLPERTGETAGDARRCDGRGIKMRAGRKDDGKAFGKKNRQEVLYRLKEWEKWKSENGWKTYKQKMEVK